MKNILIGFLFGMTLFACAMGGRSARLKAPIDPSKIFWVPCSKEMTPDWKGKFCLVDCEKGLKKNGQCKQDKYKYIVKDFKLNHDFFSHMILAPEGMCL